MDDKDMKLLMDELREYAYWKTSRNHLIRKALIAHIPIERISATMIVAQSVIYDQKKRMENGQQ